MLMHLLMQAQSEAHARDSLAHAIRTADEQERRHLAAVSEFWDRTPQAWETLRRVMREAKHDEAARSPASAVETWSRVFDQLAAQAPEAGVALYALGDSGLLERASMEIVEALGRWGDVHPGDHVLDLGCGIGRLSGPLAARGATVLGVDVSMGMLSEARRREPRSPPFFVRFSGRDLAPVGDARIDLVLAVDVFPYLVHAGGDLARSILVETARVLCPGGRLVIANLSYRGDDERDRLDLAEWLASSGLQLVAAPERPFRLWDGLVFRARRA
jgi:predicted TPR repeat methyltransferase